MVGVVVVVVFLAVEAHCSSSGANACNVSIVPQRRKNTHPTRRSQGCQKKQSGNLSDNQSENLFEKLSENLS